ncbi:probable pectinesterase/pectinesterase inhibitor 61 [Helianthus annuus]|uniref:probable pectinesterase/pectinesterase inhibitor 61 n=1 Tax=Helianthus annuus TaxID=4232 RepID=UPI000B907D95|nr:probable pectinesterase/pectinesterase inhibitor 61 [Helianthus annuus]
MMNYGRLEPKSQAESSEEAANKPPTKSKSKLKLLLLVIGIILTVASAVSVTLAVTLRPKSSGGSGSMIRPKPTKAISRVCSRTLYHNLCVNSFLDFPGSLSATDKDLVHISLSSNLIVAVMV